MRDDPQTLGYQRYTSDHVLDRLGRHVLIQEFTRALDAIQRRADDEFAPIDWKTLHGEWIREDLPDGHLDALRLRLTVRTR